MKFNWLHKTVEELRSVHWDPEFLKMRNLLPSDDNFFGLFCFTCTLKYIWKISPQSHDVWLLKLAVMWILTFLFLSMPKQNLLGTLRPKKSASLGLYRPLCDRLANLWSVTGTSFSWEYLFSFPKSTRHLLRRRCKGKYFGYFRNVGDVFDLV